MKETKYQSFKYWKTQEVEDTFGIEAVEDSKELEDWLSASCEISANEKRQLTVLQKELKEKAAYWNEATLKFFFLAPLISMVGFNTKKYNGFAEAKLELTHDNQVIQGKVDFLVATGKQIPKSPFFTLHEYKPEPNISTDPRGQLLIALLAAQTNNRKKELDIPLYGVYVIGRLFFFVYFYNNRYAVSLAYDATRDDLKRIYCILKKVKVYIEGSISNT